MWQIGVVVDDIDAAKAELGAVFGLDWVPLERQVEVVHEGMAKQIDLRVALSAQGPVHLELIQAQEGTPWWPAHGFDHIAFWESDLVGRAEELETSGFTREATYPTDDGSPIGFTYHRSPGGFRLEHVDESRREAMMAWLSGGEFPSLDAMGDA